MTTRDFCFWIQGFLEIHDAGLAERAPEKLIGTPLTGAQTNMIRQHLALVFKHEAEKTSTISEGDKTKLSDPLIHDFLRDLEPPVYC